MARLKRKYLQFNDLVFDTYTANADYSASFKAGTISYNYANGALPSIRKGTQYTQPQSLSITIQQDTRRFNCDQKTLYKEHVLTQLTKTGRLWAVDGHNLLWAWAFISDYSEVYEETLDRLSIDVVFVIYEGVWHIADRLRTFLFPHDPCQFDTCGQYEFVPEPCIDYIQTNATPCCTSCYCISDDLIEALCGASESIYDGLYATCSPLYRIEYDCGRAERVWGKNLLLGVGQCKASNSAERIDGRFYSNTILDTTGTFTFVGTFKDLLFTLNGNSVRIKGTYNGYLTIHSNGEVTYGPTDECPGEPINLNNIEIPNGSTLGLTVVHGWNSFNIETNNCTASACFYYRIDAITI